MTLYQLLNFSEGTLWLITAIVLPKFMVLKTARHKKACRIASIGFVIFAISDFIEGSLDREFHLWLWLLKISCGVILMIARIYYVGRRNFKFTDRYLVFFLFCIIVALSIGWISY